MTVWVSTINIGETQDYTTEKDAETQNIPKRKTWPDKAGKEIKEINQTVGQKQKPWAKTMDKSTPLKAVN